MIENELVFEFVSRQLWLDRENTKFGLSLFSIMSKHWRVSHAGGSNAWIYDSTRALFNLNSLLLSPLLSSSKVWQLFSGNKSHAWLKASIDWNHNLTLLRGHWLKYFVSVPVWVSLSNISVKKLKSNSGLL